MSLVVIEGHQRICVHKNVSDETTMIPPRQMLLVTFSNSWTTKAPSPHKGFRKDQFVPMWEIFHFFRKMTGNSSLIPNPRVRVVSPFLML